MARVVRWPQMLQVNATRIRRRGDFVNKDHGKVDTCESDSEFSGADGPFKPEPVVQPLTFTELNTNPIAASLESVCLLRIGTASLDSLLESDRSSDSLPLFLGEVENRRSLLEEKSLERGVKTEREEGGAVAMVRVEVRVSIGWCIDRRRIQNGIRNGSFCGR